MKLQKRDCPLEIELVPRGAGWTYVYLITGGERLFFIISNTMMREQFSDFVRILYFFTPAQYDLDLPNRFVDCVDGDFSLDEVPCEVAVEFRAANRTAVHYIDIPHKAEFTWDEEPGYSHWSLERVPNLDEDFNVKLHIEIQRHEQRDGVYDSGFEKEYDFEFRYKDLCYAVAKAYTKVLRVFGFWGYHVSTYHESVCVHHLLYLKAVALDCLEVRKWTPHPSGDGEITKIEDEIELLMFDM
jgi:hypothetical protein